MGEFIPHAEHGGFLHPYPKVKLELAKKMLSLRRKERELLDAARIARRKLQERIKAERKKIVDSLREREQQLSARESEIELKLANFDKEVRKVANRRVAERTREITVQLRKTRSALARTRETGMAEGARREKLKSSKRIIRLQERVFSLQRELESRTSEEMGEAAEEDLLSIIRKEFPDDVVTRVSKGEPGGDVKQIVRWQGRPCGIIVYEAKNVKSWSNTYLNKAMRYRSQYNTPHVILVSTAFPGKEKMFCVKNKIPIIHPSKVAYLAPLIRESAIALATSRLPEQEKISKMEEIYQYLQSPEFQERVNDVLNATENLRKLQAREKRTHENLWSKEEEEIKWIQQATLQIQNKIKAITQRIPVLPILKIVRRPK